MIPLMIGMGLLSSANEYSQGHWATGTFDLVTSLLPFATKGSRAAVFDTVFGEKYFWAPKPSVITRAEMIRITLGDRYQFSSNREIFLRNSFKFLPRDAVQAYGVGELGNFALAKAYEFRFGTGNVHSSLDHGPATTYPEQLNRVLSVYSPTGRYSPTGKASRFLSWSDYVDAIRQALAAHKSNPALSEHPVKTPRGGSLPDRFTQVSHGDLPYEYSNRSV
jgi:hypothetical protein